MASQFRWTSKSVDLLTPDQLPSRNRGLELVRTRPEKAEVSTPSQRQRTVLSKDTVLTWDASRGCTDDSFLNTSNVGVYRLTVHARGLTAKGLVLPGLSRWVFEYCTVTE